MDAPTFLLAMVESARVLAFDTETRGLDEDHDSYVIGYVAATPTHSIYVPVRHTPGGNAFDDPLPFERALAAAFRKRARLGLRTVGFALPFDLWMAAKHGIIIEGPLEDAQLNEVLIRDDRGRAYDLEASCKRHGIAGKSDAELYERLHPFAVADKGLFRAKEAGRQNMAYFHRLAGDDPMAVAYAEGDGRATFDLWAKQQPLLDELNLRRVWKLECDLLPYVARMRRKGLRVDVGYGARAKDLVREENERRRAAMNVPATFKSKSPQHVADWLFKNGVVSLPKTATGLYSTRKAILERLEAGQLVLSLRKVETAESGFILPLTEKHLQNGRVHIELVQNANGVAGTHTGRFSSRNPNLQAYPKRDRFLGQIVRPLIIPDEGWEIGEADVSQQEPRLYSHFTQEKVLLDGYNATPFVDVHTITSKLLGIPRDPAKTLGLSLFNGMGAKTLAERLNVPEPIARKMRWDFFDAYPAIRRFTEEAPKIAKARGYVFTVLGRRAYFSDNWHMAVSRVIQGSAADQMKLALLNALMYCDMHQDDVEILMTIHDSVLFQRRQGFDLTEFKRCLEDMSKLTQIVDGREVPMRVPFPVAIGLGKNWSEASYGQKG